MDFTHSEDRRMMTASLGRYLADQYDAEFRNKVANSAEGYSSTRWRSLAELGIVGALFDEAAGGFGGAGFDLAVVFEELGRHLVVEPFLPTLVAGSLLAKSGQGHHSETLAALIDGEKIAGFAHIEPQASLDRLNVATCARQENGRWYLDGSKAVVLQAEACDLLVVSARTSGAATDEAGISLFVVPTDAPGLALRGYSLVSGGRAAEVELKHVELDAAALLGDIDAGWPLLEMALGRGLLALSAEALGAAETAKQMTTDYLKERKQFGRHLGSFQALQHRMVELLLEIEQLRSAVIDAAARLESTDASERRMALARAKYTAGRVGALVAEEAIQLHGGIGMSWELPLAHYAKRLIMIDHQLGDMDFHLQRYIEMAREAV